MVVSIDYRYRLTGNCIEYRQYVSISITVLIFECSSINNLARHFGKWKQNTETQEVGVEAGPLTASIDERV